MPPPENWTAALSQPQPGSDAALALGWTWPAARQAVDDHKRGTFTMSWQLSLDIESLPAIRAAMAQRLASPCGLPWEVVGPARAPGRLEAESGAATWKNHGRRLLRSTLKDYIKMGFSVLQHPSAVNPVTLRREILTIERWPLSQVRYTATPFPDVWQPGKWIERYYAIQFGIGDSMGATLYGPQDPSISRAQIPDAAYVPGGAGVWVRFIQLPRPGETDGHWTVIGEGDQPHMDGAILGVDVAFVGGSIMKRAGFNLVKTLGRQSPVAELPGTVAVNTPEGIAASKVVAGLGVTTDGAVLPGGVKLGAFSLTTPNAELFPDFAGLNLEDVELAILGRSGTMAKEDAQYTAKGSPVERVPEKLVRSDVGVIERGVSLLLTTIAQQNAGPGVEVRLVGHMPDTEQEARKLAAQTLAKGESEKLALFHKAFYAMRDNGFEPTQDEVNEMARDAGVRAPKIPPGGLPPPLVKIPKPTVPITGEGGAALPAPPPPSGAPSVPASPPS